MRPYKKLYPKPDDDDNLQIVEHQPGLLLVLLDGSEHGQRQAHEDEAEDDGVVAEGCLATGSLKEVIDQGLSLLDSGISSGCFKLDWFPKETCTLMVMSG